MSSFLPISPSPPSVVSPPPRVVPPAWPRPWPPSAAWAAAAVALPTSQGPSGPSPSAWDGFGVVRGRWRFFKHINIYIYNFIAPIFPPKNKWGYSMYIREYHPFTHLRNGCLFIYFIDLVIGTIIMNHHEAFPKTTGFRFTICSSNMPFWERKNSFSWIFPDSSHLYTHLVRGFPSQPIPAMFDPPFATRVGWIATRRKRSHISFILADNK